jgi:excisionase family DNA binding protein
MTAAAPETTGRAYAYTVQEVAEMLKVSPNFIRDRIRDGSLPAVEIGTEARLKTRVLAADLDTYLNNRRYQ